MNGDGPVCGGSTASRAAVRAMCPAVAIVVVVLMAACGLPGDSSAEPTPCASPGEVYAQRVLVEHGDGSWGETTLFLVCTPERTVAIVDSEGNDYRGLEDFRARNNLFTEDDTILLPDDFPAVDRTGDVEIVSVSGHTSSSPSWWLIGGIALGLVGGGVGIGWLLVRRRRTRDRQIGDDPAESSA